MKISNLKDKLLTCAIIAVLVGIMYLFDIPCPFKWLFKIPCPGCGMTRAYISLLHLDIPGAFGFNPMFWSVPILFLIYLFDGRLFKNSLLNTILTASIIAGFFIFWIVDLIF